MLYDLHDYLSNRPRLTLNHEHLPILRRIGKMSLHDRLIITLGQALQGLKCLVSD